MFNKFIHNGEVFTALGIEEEDFVSYIRVLGGGVDDFFNSVECEPTGFSDEMPEEVKKIKNKLEKAKPREIFYGVAISTPQKGFPASEIYRTRKWEKTPVGVFTTSTVKKIFRGRRSSQWMAFITQSGTGYIVCLPYKN